MNEQITVVGVSRVVTKGKWPEIPKRFAQFLINRKGVRNADGTEGYFLVEGRGELATLMERYIGTVSGVTAGEVELVRRWVGRTPDERFALSVSLDETYSERFDSDRSVIWLVPEYVECECDADYLRAVPEGGPSEGQVACQTCGTLFEELPDARREAVIEAGLPFNPYRSEFVGYA